MPFVPPPSSSVHLKRGPHVTRLGTPVQPTFNQDSRIKPVAENIIAEIQSRVHYRFGLFLPLALFPRSDHFCSVCLFCLINGLFRARLFSRLITDIVRAERRLLLRAGSDRR
ncbi:hypothetical protein Zmor_009339 [Zophobas morio]|mgnify:FL=1|uniref:Uncharacterized protein n=1 Tax=Zophobas morio TaxID=2755281 RepID=A0AA38MHS9_9CUCU|nr:hypothetical protein Zmor_009339 [Zophobas morio]